MKILLDPQIFNSQKYGGISRYYTEVFTRLATNNDILFPAYSVQNIYFNESNLVTFRQKAYSLYIRILYKFSIRRIENTKERNSSFFINTVLSQRFDVFVPTYYDSYFIDYLGSKPFVLTVYDMIHELFPEFFFNDKMVVHNKKYLIEKATRIIAVSENTKKDIISIYPHIDNSKIDVVYHGCSIKVNKIDSKSLPEKYILFVGIRSNYKNFIFLVHSITDLLRNDNDLHLMCAGGGDFNFIEKELISKLGFDSQIIQKYFNEDELGYFYSRAICFVFPSMYEGFGIPVLESMTCGCPVVLGKHSSFPEVAGDAGVYFDIANAQDLKNKIQSLIQNKSLRDEFSLKGLKQVKKFSWEKAASGCLSVYKKACAIN
jgi:glycosyltransferase involved in cell wall biosynthesis